MVRTILFTLVMLLFFSLSIGQEKTVKVSKAVFIAELVRQSKQLDSLYTQRAQELYIEYQKEKSRLAGQIEALNGVEVDSVKVVVK